MDFTLSPAERLALIERDLWNMAAAMYPWPGDAGRYVIESCWPSASREEWQHAADYVDAHPEVKVRPRRHMPDVRAAYELAAKELSHWAAAECAAGRFDRARDLLRQAFVAAPHKVEDWRYFARIIDNREQAATATWVREDELDRWVLPGQRSEAGALLTAGFQITDESLRTFGREYIESHTLRGLPKLPEMAWEVDS